MAWHNEEQPFAIGYSDGKVLLAMRDHEKQSATIDACASSVFNLMWDPTGWSQFINRWIESGAKFWHYFRETSFGDGRGVVHCQSVEGLWWHVAWWLSSTAWKQGHVPKLVPPSRHTPISLPHAFHVCVYLCFSASQQILQCFFYGFRGCENGVAHVWVLPQPCDSEGQIELRSTSSETFSKIKTSQNPRHSRSTSNVEGRYSKLH